MQIDPAQLLLSLPRLMFGSPPRPTGTRRFTDRRVLQPGDFHVETDYRGQRPVLELLESLRTLGSRSLAALGDQHAMAICSPGRGEGRSLLACNLAASLAHDTRREVVLVDADLRGPTLHELLGVPAGPGLADVQPEAGNNRLLCPTAHENLYLLRAGSPPDDPVPLLQDGRIERIVERLSARGALVLFDTPPTSEVIDARLVAERVHGVISVVKLGSTRRGLLAEHYRKLAGLPFLGAVCNHGETWLPPWLERLL